MVLGKEIHDFAKNLWGFNRSLTGDGNRKTLNLIKNKLSNLNIVEVPSGTKVFDWTVPLEWKVKNAWIICPDGKKICNFNDNNLHLVGYSYSINKKVSKKQLFKNLHSLKNKPNAIPYVTSYYNKNWGFCISENQRKLLKEGMYEIFIDTEHFHGSLTYGELLIKGRSQKEIFLSTYICHPSMANNELSGPCVTTYLASWLLKNKKLRYSYRIIFIPETIGSIVYISKNLKILKDKIIAGYNVTCVGDEKSFSFLPSRLGNTISDKMGIHILKHLDKNYIKYGWAERGSDERQYCAPGVDLPIASIMRSKYGTYDEYHTSLDDLISVVTPEGLDGGFKAIQLALEGLEQNFYPETQIICEPQLGKRNLYPNLSSRPGIPSLMLNILSWSDGQNSLLDIAEKCNEPIWKLYPIIKILVKEKILKPIDF